MSSHVPVFILYLSIFIPFLNNFEHVFPFRYLPVSLRYLLEFGESERSRSEREREIDRERKKTTWYLLGNFTYTVF